MKITKQNLQKEGYMVPRAEAYEMMQEACILSSSHMTGGGGGTGPFDEDDLGEI